MGWLQAVHDFIVQAIWYYDKFEKWVGWLWWFFEAFYTIYFVRLVWFRMGRVQIDPKGYYHDHTEAKRDSGKCQQKTSGSKLR